MLSKKNHILTELKKQLGELKRRLVFYYHCVCIHVYICIFSCFTLSIYVNVHFYWVEMDVFRMKSILLVWRNSKQAKYYVYKLGFIHVYKQLLPVGYNEFEIQSTYIMYVHIVLLYFMQFLRDFKYIEVIKNMCK